MNSNTNQSDNTDFQSVFTINGEKKLKIQTGSKTDIGGNRTNQDVLFKIQLPDQNGCLIGVADGHGEHGEIAAQTTEKCFRSSIQNRFSELVENPVAFLESNFEEIQNQIRLELRDLYEKKGLDVQIEENGCISKRNPPSDVYTKLNGYRWFDVIGGTTLSVVLLLGKIMYIANVGDSSGLLCSKYPILKNSHIKYEKDAAVPLKIVTNIVNPDEPSSNYIEITVNTHSPENPAEYVRMRDVKRSEDNPHMAELMCIYDKQYEEKVDCPKVFNISEEGIPTVRSDEEINGEYYYKNVRKDKATYVTDKTGKRVLAATRALGDFKLNSLGLTYKPEIQSIDLGPVFGELKTKIDENKATASGGSEEQVVDPPTICVVLASDGVWDNWIYDHVSKFMMDPSCLKAINLDQTRGAERVTNSFIIRNDAFAKKNFGRNSDNATGIVMYITEEE